MLTENGLAPLNANGASRFEQDTMDGDSISNLHLTIVLTFGWKSRLEIVLLMVKTLFKIAVSIEFSVVI